jgi:cell division initiation protein
MSITAAEIQEVRFGEVKRGYDPDEVDEFLERVAADVDTLSRALGEAASRIKAAEERAAAAEKRAEEAALSPAPAPKPAFDDFVPLAPPQPEAEKESDVSAEIISKAFIAAQKSADSLVEEARKEAEKVYREAESKGRDIVREALAGKQKTLEEVDRLRESSEQFRTEYLSLLKHFQADAQKRLSAFDEAIPEKPEVEAAKKAQETLLAANDAANVEHAAEAPRAATPLPQVDDDDLDIEEID